VDKFGDNKSQRLSTKDPKTGKKIKNGARICAAAGTAHTRAKSGGFGTRRLQRGQKGGG